VRGEHVERLRVAQQLLAVARARKVDGGRAERGRVPEVRVREDGDGAPGARRFRVQAREEGRVELEQAGVACPRVSLIPRLVRVHGGAVPTRNEENHDLGRGALVSGVRIPVREGRAPDDRVPERRFDVGAL
jgi:hypothetical protein